MTQTTLDHSGRALPLSHQYDDGWNYAPEPRITQPGDEIYSEYGGRWLRCIAIGFHMPSNLRYRRRKPQPPRKHGREYEEAQGREITEVLQAFELTLHAEIAEKEGVSNGAGI